MQVFVHSEVSVLGASVQLQLRHLPSKLSQRSVHYSRVLAFGERVLNRVNSVSQDAFFKGKKNLRPLCNRAESIMLEDESCASGSVRRSIVAANYDSSPKLARIDDCIDHSDGVTSSSFVADHVTISPFAPLVQPPDRGIGNGYGQTKLGRPKTGALEVGGFSLEGVSVGGQETCVMVPAYKVAFDSGRCPERIIHQDFLFITHPHMDHIGGICMYVASRGLLKMKKPTVIVPRCVKETVEKLFLIQRELDGSDLPVNLIGLDIGEEFNMGKNVVVKAFKTYHVVPSQGYILYSVKEKLKPEYMGLPGDKIKSLKASGVMITETVKLPEVAFTGDTTSEFITDKANQDVLNAKLLIMESTFLDNYMSVEKAHEYGHTHFSEIVKLGDHFKNKNIVLIHFSARYRQEDIFKALKELPPILQGRVVALTEGF
ncbi:hypothetical protein CY35_06G107600 [Sphagnum magellanicum]|nr:hypothetical protein CY35_06G107600 [Sphagnum magellanicum]